MGSFFLVRERTRDRFRARLRVLIGRGGILFSFFGANGRHGRGHCTRPPTRLEVLPRRNRTRNGSTCTSVTRSMSVKKLGRKGKLDRDLPFRLRQTFAIFPNRFCGWGNYARFAVFLDNLGLRNKPRVSHDPALATRHKVKGRAGPNSLGSLLNRFLPQWSKRVQYWRTSAWPTPHQQPPEQGPLLTSQ